MLIHAQNEKKKKLLEQGIREQHDRYYILSGIPILVTMINATQFQSNHIMTLLRF